MAMAANSVTPNSLVEKSCNIIITTVRSLPLNFSITETPFSMYLTVRKSLVKNAHGLETLNLEQKDDRVQLLKESNQNLKDNLEEAVIECEENTEYISELEEKNKVLLDKLELSEKKIIELEKINALKEVEVEPTKARNNLLVTENKALKADVKDLSKELNLSKLEGDETTNYFKKQIEFLEKSLKTQQSESVETAQKLKIERAALKTFRDKSRIEKQDISSQTNTNEDIPYKVTDPLPPIFSMELRHKSKPIKFLSRSIPNFNSILWCPPDDDFSEAANEFLADQYDREIEEFYLDAREEARVKHSADQHGHSGQTRDLCHGQDQAVPD